MSVLGPDDGVGVDYGVEQHLEGTGAVDAELVVLFEVDFGEEGLVAQASVGVVAARIDVGAVLQQVEGVVQMSPGLTVLAVVSLEATVHQAEFSCDAILFPF